MRFIAYLAASVASVGYQGLTMATKLQMNSLQQFESFDSMGQVYELAQAQAESQGQALPKALGKSSLIEI